MKSAYRYPSCFATWDRFDRRDGGEDSSLVIDVANVILRNVAVADEGF